MKTPSFFSKWAIGTTAVTVPLALTSVLLGMRQEIETPTPWFVFAFSVTSGFIGAIVAVALREKEKAVANRRDRRSRSADSTAPPRHAEFLLLLLLPKAQREALPGDLEEEFHGVDSKFGRRYARNWYWYQTFRSVGPLVLQLLRRIIGWTALWQIVGQLLRRLG